jgi:hypothetical protein
MILALALLIAAPADLVAGTWEGTSLCQVKPSPCHDEHVIYRVKPSAPRRYRIDAYKLVAGQEEFMGAIDVTFDPAAGQLDGAVGKSGRPMGQLRLMLHGARLIGRMTQPDGTLYRLIDVTKR